MDNHTNNIYIQLFFYCIIFFYYVIKPFLVACSLVKALKKKVFFLDVLNVSATVYAWTGCT